MLAFLYLAYATVMVLLHPQFIYPFGADPFDDPAFEQRIITERDVHVARLDGTSEEAVLFFMGNGGALAYFAQTLEAHRRADRTLVAMEYPGGGGIPGQPHEVALKADALAMYDWLAASHEGPIVVHGYSMGTGLAQYVAANRDVKAILLDAPYVRMCELMTRASFLPACLLPGVQRWDSAALVGRLDAPVLIQHGEADQLIPQRDGARLAELMREVDVVVEFVSVPGATHNNLAGQHGYDERISEFLARSVP